MMYVHTFFIALVLQLFGYSPKLWRGKLFETVIHLLFLLLWLYLAVVFFYVYFKTA